MENGIPNNLQNMILKDLEKLPDAPENYPCGLINMLLKDLEKLSDVPENYYIVIKIFCVFPIRLEDYGELSKSICSGLKDLNFPSYMAIFYGVGYRPFKNKYEILVSFYTFLDYTIVVPSNMSRYNSKGCYANPINEKLYGDCFNMLNEIAMLIINFASRRRTSNMIRSQIILSFFEGKFFKKIDKKSTNKIT